MGSQRRRQSAEVYRRRRILVGVLAVLVLVLTGWLISLALGAGQDPEDAAPGGSAAEEEAPGQAGDATGAESGSADDSSPGSGDDGEADRTDSAQEQAQDGPAGDGSCRTGDLEVRAATGSESYGPGFAPMLVMEVENTADYACEADLGTAEQEFLVEHAGATVFSTAECSVSRESLPVELEPGQVEQARFTWPRSDSAEDCAEPATLAPGDYVLTVSLSGVRSEPHEFSLTGG